MLEELIIENIALIDRLQIEFGSGLNVLSGETGAGKSIVIDSLNFVLGQRADRSLIRYGTDRAAVTAEFTIESGSNTQAAAQRLGVDCSENTILLRRVMTADGKNACYVNGVKITLSMLREITVTLVDIYGQHESTQMLNAETHIAVLDAYAQKELAPLLSRQSRLYRDYRDLKEKIAQYGSLSDVSKNLDLLNYQITEISEADLQVGEEDRLLADRKRMNHAQAIAQALYTGCELLDGENDVNALTLVAECAGQLKSIREYDPSVEETVARLDSVKIELRDIADTLRAQAEASEFDPAAFAACEERIALIRTLKRKYGADEAAVLNYLETIRARYDFLSDGEAALEKLEREQDELGKDLYDNALALSRERRAQASLLSAKLEEQLRELGLNGCRFSVCFDETPAMEDGLESIGERGFDQAVFLFSANVGQPLRELNKIISGGELSRFMLAVKNVIADTDAIGTMVFDEIDTGISGRIAQVVAEKLYRISADKQVLAVTHLPQLASMADRHYLIEKRVVSNDTRTSVRLLSNKEEITELARLIGGRETDHALLHAQEMKEYANSLKKRV